MKVTFLNLFEKVSWFFLPILMKILLFAKNIQTPILHLMRYTLRGHWSSHYVNFYLKIHFYLDILFVWNLILSKFGMNAKIIKTHIFIICYLTSKVLEGQDNSVLIASWSFTFFVNRALISSIKLLNEDRQTNFTNFPL